MERHNLFVPSKLAYAKGERPDVPCILCAAIAGDPRVTGLVAAKTDHFAILANLYPYNPGHLMIVPLRHVEDIVELSAEEAAALHQTTVSVIGILRELYTPSGINLGYNIGATSGASIPHLHQHVVPRHRTEMGFIDIVGGAKIIVEDPHVTMARVSDAWRQRHL